MDSDGDFISDVIYVDGLQGNLWAFDVSSSNPQEWGSKFGVPVAPTVVQINTARSMMMVVASDESLDDDKALSAVAPSVDIITEENTRTAYNNPTPLFSTCTDVMCRLPKPITAKPQVERNPAGGLMVYFGTGKYTNLGDNFKAYQSDYYDTFMVSMITVKC